ncbi:MAG: conjugal transfer protein TraF, partial [Pseudomonadota bacterium]|nr:conjugal transfer protein TraF [Pseudomonadota bacterium]
MRSSLTLAVIVSLLGTSAVPQMAVAQVSEPSLIQHDEPMEGANVPDQTGDDFYCRERKLGTWFYCEKPKAKARDQSVEQDSQSATEQLAAITKELDEKKARAILQPTTENIAAYIGFQREQLNRASS